MSTTLAQLRTKTLIALDDPNGVNWSNTVIDSHINDAQRALWIELSDQDDSFGQREATATMVDGQEDYPLPADILGRRIRALYAYDAVTDDWSEIVKAGLEEVIADGMTEVDNPYKYCLLDGYIKLGPPPGSAANTLRIFYIRQPTVLTAATDTMDSDDEYAEYIAVDAAVRAMLPKGGDVTYLTGKKAELLAEAQKSVMSEALIQAKVVWNY